MRSIVRSCCAVLAATLFLWGCNDQPSPLGSDFITDTLVTVVVGPDDAVLLDSAYSGRIEIPLTNGGDIGRISTFLVGRTPGARATSFMRFGTVPDSLASLQESEIVSMSLKLFPTSYAYGDTASNTLSFSVNRITGLWSPASTTDSIRNGNFLGEQFGSFSGTIVFADSATPVLIPLSDKQQVYNWLYADSAKYGLALVPGDGSGLIRQFSTIGVGDVNRSTSSIELIYKRTGSDRTDTVALPAAFINTFVESMNPPQPDRITTQGGVIYRSHLFFDIGAIPPLATIHRAELVLTLDPAATQIGRVTVEPKLIARFASDSTLKSSDESYALATRRGNSDEYVFPNIAPAVERWLRGEANYGMLLHPETGRELSEVNRLVFYDLNHPDPSKRPRLTIVYSVRGPK